MASGIFILFYLNNLVNFEIQWFASFTTGESYTTFISKDISLKPKQLKHSGCNIFFFFAGK